MACCNQIIATNAGGIPYIVSTNTTVGTETINIALGVRRIQPVGYLTIMISTVIPADATTTFSNDVFSTIFNIFWQATSTVNINLLSTLFT